MRQHIEPAEREVALAREREAEDARQRVHGGHRLHSVFELARGLRRRREWKSSFSVRSVARRAVGSVPLLSALQMATGTRDGTALSRDGALTSPAHRRCRASLTRRRRHSLAALVLARQSPQLRVLPEALRALTALELLDVRGNLLETLPAGWRERTGCVLAEGNPLLNCRRPANRHSARGRQLQPTRALFRDGATEWAGHVPAVGAPPGRTSCADGDARLIVRGGRVGRRRAGMPGSCWFLSAVAVVAMRGGLAERTFALAAVGVCRPADVQPGRKAAGAA